jgi:hypothetical protein
MFRGEFLILGVTVSMSFVVRSLWLNITMKEETINVTNVVGWIKGAVEPGKYLLPIIS